jgi:uncharacterized membrane protein YbhN (UPF0104 family)
MGGAAIAIELTALAPAAPIALALGLMLHLAKLAAKGLAWHGVLRTALPAHPLRRRDTLAAYLPSVGLNALLPGRVGLIARVALVKSRAPGAPCATVATTMAAESAANLAPLAPVLVLAVLLAPAMGPPAVGAPPIPPAALAVAALAVVIPALVAIRRCGAPGRLARAAASQARHGFAIFAGRPAALARVVAWETVAWAARIGSLAFFLAAFGLRPEPAVIAAVLLAQVAASLAVVMPVGAGVQQLALVAALSGVASPAQALAFGIGMQLAVAATGIAAGVAALVVGGGGRETGRVAAGAARSLAAALARARPQRKVAESIVARKNSPSDQPSSPAQPALNAEGMV